MLRRPIRCLAPILLPPLGNCYQIRCKNAWVKSVTGAPCVGRMGMQSLPTSAKSLVGSPKLPRGLQSSALCELPRPEVIPTRLKSIQMPHQLVHPFQSHHHHQNRNRVERHGSGTGNRHHPIYFLHRVNFSSSLHRPDHLHPFRKHVSFLLLVPVPMYRALSCSDEIGAPPEVDIMTVY